MTPKEVAEKFFGQCNLDGNWCTTHNHHWRVAVLDDTECPVLTGLIELAEESMVEYKQTLRTQVNALVHAGDYDQMGKNFYVRLDDVLMLIDEETNG